MENFGKIKTAFNEILAEGIVSKDNKRKNLFKQYVKTIKESEILRTQFLVYDNIENQFDADQFSANIFVTENIQLLNKFKPSDIVSENKKLVDLSEEVKETLDNSYDLANLHESISKLIFTKRNPKTISERTTNTKNVIDYITKNEVKEVSEALDVPSSVLLGICVEKYNQRYSTLTESEKKVIKVLIESNDEEKLIVYSDVIKECIELIDAKLTESDLDTKDRLLKVKDKLLNDKKEINEDFTKNISKLIELKNSLNNNE